VIINCWCVVDNSYGRRRWSGFSPRVYCAAGTSQEICIKQGEECCHRRPVWYSVNQSRYDQLIMWSLCWVKSAYRSWKIMVNKVNDCRVGTAHIGTLQICFCVYASPVGGQERCRISTPHFLAECCKRHLNQGTFYCIVHCLPFLSYIILISVFSVFYFVFCRVFFQREPTWIAL